MRANPISASFGLRTVGACVLMVGGMLAGCQTNYAVDITNKTPQPIRADIFRKGGDGAVLGDSRRLGPGDRRSVGPVRTSKDHGAFLSIDTMGNPGRPITTDLPAGTSYFEIHQDGDGPNAPLRIVEKR